MHRNFKLALLWLLVLALPAQGVAATTMQLCGPIHQRMMAGVQKALVQNGHAAHATQHLQHQHTQHNDGAVIADGQDHAKGTHQHPVDKVNCSACAICCVSATVPTFAFRIPELTILSDVFRPTEQPGFVGFIPEGPEHPPRHILV